MLKHETIAFLPKDAQIPQEVIDLVNEMLTLRNGEETEVEVTVIQ
jgi:hypothetical protein